MALRWSCTLRHLQGSITHKFLQLYTSKFKPRKMSGFQGKEPTVNAAEMEGGCERQRKQQCSLRRQKTDGYLSFKHSRGICSMCISDTARLCKHPSTWFNEGGLSMCPCGSVWLHWLRSAALHHKSLNQTHSRAPGNCAVKIKYAGLHAFWICLLILMTQHLSSLYWWCS